MADHHLKTELFDQFARIGGALASGRRIEILDVLANGERSVEVLAKQVRLSIANTSRHLQVLKEAGLVASRRESNHVLYRLATAEVYWLWASLRSLAANRLAEVERLVAAYVGSRDQLEPVTREELQRRLDQLPRDRDVVAYCRGPYCAFAPEAVAVLRSQGFQARRLEDGLPEWAASGLPVE